MEKTNQIFFGQIPEKAMLPLKGNASVVSAPNLELQPPLLLHRYLDNVLNNAVEQTSSNGLHLIALTTRTVDGETLTEYTYFQLQAHANRIANRFDELLQTNEASASRRHPTEHDDVPFVAFCTRKSPELCIAILGALKAGCAYVPIDYDWPEERLRYVLNDAHPSVVVYDDACKYMGVVKQYCAENHMADPITLDELFEVGLSDKVTNKRGVITNETSKDYHTAVVLYTSGTTGQPKGCKLPHRGLMNALQFRLKHVPHYPDEEGLLKTVMTFSDSVLEMFETWFNLRPLVVVTKEDLLDVTWFLRFLEANNRIYRMFVVPSLLKMMIDVLNSEQRLFRGGLKMIATGGEAFSASLLEEFFETFPGCAVANYYGQTECCADITCEVWKDLGEFRARLSDTGLIAIGQPISNLTVYILDSGLTPVDIGETGELFASGASVSSSYLGSVTLSKFLPNHLAASFIPPHERETHSILLKTGDLAVCHLDSQNHPVLYLVGRSDDMVKVAGQKVHLAEVLKAMETLPHVLECAVASLVREGEIKIIGFVRFALTEGESEASLLRAGRDALARQLPTYAVPQLISYSEALPRTEAGKVAKQALLKYYRANYENLTQNSTNTPLGILATAVGVTENEIDVNKNFVENGGSSLKILPAVLALQKAGFRIELQEFLAAKTVQDVVNMCLHVQATNGNSDSPPKSVSTCSFVVIMKPISELHKDEVINVIAESFGNHSDLAMFGETSVEDERRACELDYAQYLVDGLSFAFVRKSDARVVAVSLGTDWETHSPPLPKDSDDVYGRDVGELLEAVDEGLQPFLPKGRGKVWHGKLLGILPSLDASDKVALSYMVIEAEIKKATELGFECIACETASPMVQQLVHDFVRHETLFKIRPRDFVSSNGRKLWSKYPEDYYLYGDVMWLNKKSS